MSIVQISPKKKVAGKIVAPPSKSYAQRAIAIGGLAQNNIVIKQPGNSADVLAAIRVLEDLNATMFLEGGDVIVHREIDMESKADIMINCGESGLSTRLFSAFSLLFDQTFEIRGEGSINDRTMTMIEEGLQQFGKTILSNDGKLPLKISGKAKADKVVIDGSVSSQFVTGILLVAPFLAFDTTIQILNLKSRPYISMTLDIMRKFGLEFKLIGPDTYFIEGNQEIYKPVEYIVEGDWSSASFFAVAGAIGGSMTLTGLKKFSKQADLKIIEVIEKAGATVLWDKEDVEIQKNTLNPFEFDATDCPDLFPPIVVLASFASGVSRIKGVHRLIHKESNRAIALQKECAKVGVKIVVEGDEMLVYGGNVVVGENVVFDSHNDHRIAMAMSLYAIGAKHAFTIQEAEAVNKSFPDFYTYFEYI